MRTLTIIPGNSVIAILFVFLLCGCTRTVYEEVPVVVKEVHNDTVFRTLHVHDSVFHSVIQKGDTVFDTRYVQHLVHDTVRVTSRDTVPVPKYIRTTITKEVERPLSLWQKVTQTIGGASIIALLVFALVRLRRLFS